MKKILNLDEYLTLLNEYQENNPDMIYNHIMLPGEADAHIKNGKLYYEVRNGGLFFCVAEKDYYKWYCHVPESADIHFEKMDKAQLIECLYVQGKEDLHVQKFREKVESFGFEFYVDNRRYRAVINEEHLIPLESGHVRDDFTWEYAVKEDIPTIYNLWEVMDPYNSTIPEEDELTQWINDKDFVIMKKSGQLCGVVRLKRENKKTASMWLMSVGKEFRRMGIATDLFKVPLSVLKERGYARIISWCDEKNLPIHPVVARFGFAYDGTVSISYIMK